MDIEQHRRPFLRQMKMRLTAAKKADAAIQALIELWEKQLVHGDANPVPPGLLEAKRLVDIELGHLIHGVGETMDLRT